MFFSIDGECTGLIAGFLAAQIFFSMGLRSQIIERILAVSVGWGFLLLLNLVGAAARGEGDAVITSSSPFILYLENPPWVKSMHFKTSQTLQKEVGEKVTERNVIIESYEAAIQPGGFYFARREPSIPGVNWPNAIPPRHDPSERGMGGVCDDYYWTAYWEGD